MKRMILTLGIILPLSIHAELKAPIKIALLAGFTGVASIPSYHLLNTVKMEVKDINKQGGIKGKPIELIILDDESNPIKTIELVRDQRLDDVVGIIGFPWSQFILTAGPAIQERKVPAISILATHDDAVSSGDYLFRVCFKDRDQGIKLANFAYNEAGSRNAILFINHQNSYSLDLAKTIKKEFTKLGGQIIEELGYIPQKDSNYFINVLSAIDRSKYDSVFIPDNQVYVMPIIEAFYRLGAKDKKYFGGDGWNMGNIQIKNVQLDDFQIYVIGHWNKDAPTMRNQKFIKKFKSLYTTEPQDASALSHDALFILLEAIKNSPAINKETIKQILAKTNYNGLTGKISFDSKGNPVNKPIIIHKVYKGKRNSILYQ